MGLIMALLIIRIMILCSYDYCYTLTNKIGRQAYPRVTRHPLLPTPSLPGLFTFLPFLSEIKDFKTEYLNGYQLFH